MLKLKYLYSNYELAKKALENWEYDEKTLDDMLRRFHITANAIYPFHNAGKVYFLRLAPMGEKNLRNLQGELEFIQYLTENNFPALDLIEAKSGKVLVILDTEWGKYYACVFQKVQGIPIANTDYSADILYQYGKTLGQLHALSEKYQAKMRKQSHEDVFEWIEKVFDKYDAPEHAWNELRALRVQLSVIPKEKGTYGLVHYDFQPDNVFYDSKSRKCAVIDFDDAMYHWYALDIAQVMNALTNVMKGNVQKFEYARDKFLKGYKSEYSYTEETQNLIPYMQRFINLYGYARLIRSVAETQQNEPDWMFALRGKLRGDIKEKEEGFKSV